MCSNLLKKREEINAATKTQRTNIDGFDVVHLASQKFYTRIVKTPGNTTWSQYYIVAHTVGKDKRKLTIMYLKKCEDFWI